ncbi:thermonuclease family protein [Mycoplasmopsis adleri]|uniref:thermonuclease family protein n=1 Tax=Mycoplasmopsis adleri TaxID=51362 RepID=UPI003872F033
MNKKILLGSLVGIVAPIASVATISCNKFEDGPKIVELDTRIILDPEKVSDEMVRARILKGADGDTVTVTPLEDNGSAGIHANQPVKVRIAGIDTPEKAVGDGANVRKASKQELQFALQSSAYAEKTLKNGKEVYLFLTSGGTKDTFGRITADIFFSYEKDKVSKITDVDRSYSVEILKAGYTLPLGREISAMRHPIHLQYWTYYLMALALKYARDNNQGFFSQWSIRHASNPYEKISKTAYLIKPIGEGWRPFVKDAGGDPDYKGSSVYDYAKSGYQPIKVVYANGEVFEKGKLVKK